MLLGAPPARNDSRCFWWDEPRRVILRRSPVAQIALVGDALAWLLLAGDSRLAVITLSCMMLS
jgi:hypothetical protein